MKRNLCILAAALLLAGCDKADAPMEDHPQMEMPEQMGSESSYSEPLTAIVTVKQDEAGAVYFQLSDEDRLAPDNYEEPYIGLRRIICGLQLLSGMRCHVLWMEDILEGEVLSQSPDGADDDGLTLLEDWMTSVSDGYLTLHYSTLWGDGSVPHKLAVYSGYDETDPYQLRLVHSCNGDEALEEADALICFDINALPSTQGGYQILTLNWTTREGTAASKTFPFRTRP